MAIFNIRGYHGGLGDQLQFSTIPERLAAQGHVIHLYTGPEVQPFRNNAVKDFVWGLNPHITDPHGIYEKHTDNWNAGDIPNRPYQNRHDDFIRNIEAMHGLMPENSLPKIYYQPNKRTDIEGIIELSSISLKYDPELVRIMVREIIKHQPIGFKQLVTGHQNNGIDLPELPKIQANSLEEVSDIIHNSLCFISLNSGLHSLAAAIQRFGAFEQHCLLPGKDHEWIMRDKKFIFPGINYLKC